MKKAITLFVVLVFAFGCSDIQQKKQVSSVEQLQHKLEKMDSQLKQDFPDTLSRMRLTMMQVELKIKQNLVLDTIQLDFAANMDDYKQARKAIGPINKQYLALKKAMAEEQNTLGKLHKDIENGYGKRKSYDQYIANETKKIKQIEALNADLFKAVRQLLDTYKMIHPKLNALSNRLTSTL